MFDVADNASVFGNFSQGLSVPGTDNLYNAFYFPVGTARAKPAPETTNNYDLGVRYRSNVVQAQLSVFYNQFQNRLASAYDPELDRSVYRNLGDVKKYGIDGSLAITPVDNISLYLFGSLLKSEIKDNLVTGENRDGSQILALTAGKREAGAPKYTFGGTLRGTFGPIDLGITAKRTGERFIYDTNEATFTGSAIAERGQSLHCGNAAGLHDPGRDWPGNADLWCDCSRLLAGQSGCPGQPGIPGPERQDLCPVQRLQPV